MQTGFVEAILDGATFRLNTGEIVGLAEVHAPDMGSCTYAQVLEKLKQLIEGKEVLYDQESVDSNERIVVDVWVKSICVNDEIRRFVSFL